MKALKSTHLPTVVRKASARGSLGKLVYFLPAALLFGFIFAYPVVRLFLTALQRKSGGRTIFVGVANFLFVLTDSTFLDSIKNNVILIVVVIPLLVFICLVFSVLTYNLGKRGKIFQVILFIPYILSITVTGVLFSYLLQPNGILNNLLRKNGLSFLALDWFGNPKIAIFTVAAIIVWKELGFGTILFISRLEALSEELLDAIMIDGANWWQTVWNLYIPHLMGILFFYVTLVMIQMLSWVFNYIYVITSGSSNTMVFEYYIYKQVFIYSNQWNGSAASTMVFVVTLGIIFLQMRSRAGLASEEAGE